MAGKLFELSGPIRVVSNETGLGWSPRCISRASSVMKPGACTRVITELYQMLLGLTPPWRPAAGGTEQ